MTALSPADRARLVAILGMLGSDHAGERASAALLANRMLKERNLEWTDVIGPAAHIPESPPTRDFGLSPVRQQVLAMLRDPVGLTTKEREFLRTIMLRRRPLTSKQVAWLTDIVGRRCDVGEHP